ncbi:MAG: hypothetical protein LBK41_00470 [Clostridiales bacterium]|jgi:c-di-GMP-related signal transduction protein|nr:hypothetical protein [Clostridiales bacterium]
MENTQKNIDIVRDMLACCETLGETMRRFGERGEFLSDVDYQAAAAFSIIRLNILRKRLSADFKKAHPEFAQKLDMKKSDDVFPDKNLIWEILQYQVPHRKALLERLSKTYRLLTLDSEIPTAGTVAD